MSADPWKTATPAKPATNGTGPADEQQVRPIPTVGFDDVATRRVQWLWKGRVPYGKVTLFEGQPGEFKSGASLDVAARVTCGRAMPDGAVPERGAGNALIISAEDAIHDTIAPRLKAAGVDPQRVRVFTLHRDDDGNIVPLTIPDDLRRLKATVEEHDIHLVIVDPLVAFLAEKVDSHNDASVRRAMGPLTLFAEETGAAVIGIRHLNKGVGLAAIDRGGGSVGIGGAARSTLIFAPHPDRESFPDLRVMARTKGNLAALPPALGYTVAEELIQLDDGNVVEYPIIAWRRDPVRLTADQLVGYNADARKDAPERDAAGEWLREVLVDGPVPVGRLQDLAHDAGHSWRTVERSKPGVARSIRERDATTKATGQWLWLLLDEDDEQGTQ